MRKSALALYIALMFSASGCSAGGKSQHGPQAARGKANLVFREDFTNGRVNARWTEPGNFKPEHYEKVGVRRFAKIDGLHVVNYHLLPNLKEQEPAKLVLQGAQVPGNKNGQFDRIHLTWLELWKPDPGNKGEFILGDSSQKVARIAIWQPGDERGPGLEFWVQRANRNIQIFAFEKGPKGQPTTREYKQDSNQGLKFGQWYKFSLYARLNQLGKSDGVVELYIEPVSKHQVRSGRIEDAPEGKPFLSLQNIEWRTVPLGFNFLWIGGNASYLGVNPNKEGSFSRYIGRIRVYDDKPAPGTRS